MAEARIGRAVGLGAMVAVGLAALLGGCGGAEGRGAVAEPAVEAAPVAPVADVEACEAWAADICAAVGAEAEGCRTAHDAARMLPPSACAEARAHQAITDVDLVSAMIDDALAEARP